MLSSGCVDVRTPERMMSYSFVTMLVGKPEEEGGFSLETPGTGRSMSSWSSVAGVRVVSG